MAQARIGVIGGTGLYEIEGLTEIKEVRVKTPFGDPSDAIILGNLGGSPMAFLPRHGRGHRFSPSELPSRANIYALKSLGVEWIIAIGSVGSLKEEIQPLDLVIPDQFIDRTTGRPGTFFSGGIVAHVGFAQPFCPVLSQILSLSAREAGARVHNGGTYVAMEGPLFSTRAESELYRSWGASVIGMTALPEAKLAREAEICYSTIACVTDYDCWHAVHETVTFEMIVANLQKNVATAKKIIKLALGRIPKKRDCLCTTALQNAIATDMALVPEAKKKDLALLISKYIS
jgi:5'-methylthioadenosine phosphorylase